MFMISRVITLTSTYYIPEIVSWQLVPECKHLQRKVQKSLWKENAVCSSNTINTHICIRTTTFKDIKKQFWLAFHWRCLGKLKIVGTAFFRNRLWLGLNFQLATSSAISSDGATLSLSNHQLMGICMFYTWMNKQTHTHTHTHIEMHKR